MSRLVSQSNPYAVRGCSTRLRKKTAREQLILRMPSPWTARNGSWRTKIAWYCGESARRFNRRHPQMTCRSEFAEPAAAPDRGRAPAVSAGVEQTRGVYHHDDGP